MPVPTENPGLRAVFFALGAIPASLLCERDVGALGRRDAKLSEPYVPPAIKDRNSGREPETYSAKQGQEHYLGIVWAIVTGA